MEINILIPILAAFLSAALTLMTGFGLGTILTPVFLVFYDVKIAILIVAVVHLSNNLLKISLFSRHINIDILKRFGILTLIGAFIGAFLQGKMDSSGVKILLGIILIFLGLKEATGFGEKLRLPKKIDFIGGFLSGLLGGFVGNQGAIRSAYLLNYNITKETFVATAAIIASVVDVTRIPVYIFSNRDVLTNNGLLLLITTASAFAGTFAGKRFLQKISLKTFKIYIAAMIVIIGVLLTIRII
ncbi:sulfite exporter TauE/SafE family protein [Dissulfurispira sp.]|uniref:sulfite exporter TauE/SafE family protein n=1 Tax=Dissulfurispira sp. TaxID=2817609 RepID=UPI002FDA42FE